MIYHEIAHGYHKHIDTVPTSFAECRAKEKEADITAAHVSGYSEAAIYLFKILNANRVWENAQTHPSWEERIAYLSNLDASSPVTLQASKQICL